MSSKRYDYVIVGNSTAGIAGVEGMRSVDTQGSVAIVGREPYAAYCSPLITYVLAHKVDAGAIAYRPADFYQRLRVDTYLGKNVIRLVPKHHEVVFEDGTALKYRKLLLAAGGAPILPNLPGTDLAGVFTFTRYEDMCRVRNYLEEQKVREVVVVGGGMIGVKTAEAFGYLGLRTTVVELMERVLSTALDERGSAAAQAAMERAGLRVLTGHGAAALLGQEGKVSGVKLDEGRTLEAQLVVLAIGVRPNLELPAGAGLAVHRGVLIDDHCRTSDADIYAAGDITEAYDTLLGQSRPVAIWPNAYLQGQTAGVNMAGGEAVFNGAVAMNSIQVCGLPTISVGLTDPQAADEVLEYSSPDGRTYRKLLLRANHVVGAIFVGEIDRAGIITGLIRDGINVAEFKHKLMGRELGLLSLPREYRKHKVVGPGIEV